MLDKVNSDEYYGNVKPNIDHVFHEDRLEFLDQLSRAILSDPNCRKFPDLVSFGFFLRRRNLESFRDNMSRRARCSIERIGLGRCFHITPSNIPLNFAMSFIFGFLSGNENYVKLPSREFDQARLFLKRWEKLADSSNRYRDQRFLQMDRGSHELEQHIASCDAMLVWGGNDSIREIRSYPRKARCKVWEFPNRFSVAVLCCKAILKSSSSELSKLGRGFLSDTLTFSQNACSSPKIIFWVGGESECKRASAVFWDLLDGVLTESRFDASEMIDRAVKLGQMAQSGSSLRADSVWYEKIIKIWVEHSDPSSVAQLTDISNGTFCQIRLQTLDDLVPYLNCETIQTVTTCGVAQELIRSLIVTNGLQGGDRIVQMGAAFQFDLIWDGRYAIDELSRFVK